MKKLTFAVGLLAVLTTAAMAQQTNQSQQTGRPGVTGSSATINSSGGMTSRSGGMTSSGVHDATTGIAGSRPERDDPNSSPAAAPKATTGPSRMSRPVVGYGNEKAGGSDHRAFLTPLGNGGRQSYQLVTSAMISGN